MPEIRSKKQAEAIVLAFDFTDILARNGYPSASYESLVETGLTVYKADESNGVVRLTVGSGTQGSTYQASVKATLSSGLTFTIPVTVYINRDVIAGAIVPNSSRFLTTSTGVVLTTASGVALTIALV
jgi:hypothetical protein